MVEDLRRLIELQKLDDELARLEVEQKALPARREALAAERAASEQRLAEARAAERDAETRQRQAEHDLQDREAALAKLEGQQHQVKTNEAYTALLHEMEHARDAISSCETRILEAMEATQAGADAVVSAESDAKAAGERAASEERALAAREATLAARISELREQRAAAKEQVEPGLGELYERIAARRRPAVVAVTRGICTGCRVDIPPQSFVDLKAGKRVVTCGRCQRILMLAES